MRCRHCRAEVSLQLIDLGSAPPSNAYLTESTLSHPEKWLPLAVMVCVSCWLVQAVASPGSAELFDEDYAYFSSFSDTWLKHAERYVEAMVERFGLNGDSHVVEVASNDGYLLQYVKERRIPCLGIEPTAGTAAAARLKGIETLQEFFGVEIARLLAAQGRQADLIVANNVLAHVPDIDGFSAGVTALLKPQGAATFEFPYLKRLIEHSQFDTIYHEHFSYLSFAAVEHIFSANGLVAFDVEELGTHGGSLRVFAQRQDAGRHDIGERVVRLRDAEAAAGMLNVGYYSGFQEHADKVKDDLLTFLLTAKRRGERVAAYGAAAKGNTLLNYAGIRPDLIPFVVDRNPAKQGKFMPGSRIPIVAEERLGREQPGYVVILPWNLKAEIMQQLDYIREWGGQFVTAVPHLEVVP
jgi:hypothetical protein